MNDNTDRLINRMSSCPLELHCIHYVLPRIAYCMMLARTSQLLLASPSMCDQCGRLNWGVDATKSDVFDSWPDPLAVKFTPKGMAKSPTILGVNSRDHSYLSRTKAPGNFSSFPTWMGFTKDSVWLWKSIDQSIGIIRFSKPFKVDKQKRAKLNSETSVSN